jgi:hypothetical protein
MDGIGNLLLVDLVLSHINSSFCSLAIKVIQLVGGDNFVYYSCPVVYPSCIKKRTMRDFRT